MQQLDLQVILKAEQWLQQGQAIWLCTVLATYGSAPRVPGAMLVANAHGDYCGSLSGGCIEDDFIQRVAAGEFREPVALVRYGDGSDAPQVRLPCGGVLEVLVERFDADADALQMIQRLAAALQGESRLLRCLQLPQGHGVLTLDESRTGPRVVREGNALMIRYGAAQKLLLAGMSNVAEYCATFARSLGFQVVVCEPREEWDGQLQIEGVEIRRELPACYIAAGGCHGETAVVALTHDPRLDDLTMMEAVRSPAFYIGVMGSRRTSDKRLERLRRSGGLDERELQRIQAPIGLALGSKTPAEIALAVLADIVRVRNGVARDAL